jgi:hypothetical protein
MTMIYVTLEQLRECRSKDAITVGKQLHQRHLPDGECILNSG